MRADDPKAIEALAKLGEGWSVIYLERGSGPYGLTIAGELHGRPFFMEGGNPHWIEPDLEAEITPVAVAYRRKGDPELIHYVTPIEEAPDADEDAASGILASRRALDHWPSIKHCAAHLLGVRPPE